MVMYTGLAWFTRWLFRKDWNGCHWITEPRSVGKYRTELAKMIGITPAWLTFNGIYVLPPDVIRRPTTRLAYCTGIRRWPYSMNTTARMINSPMATMIPNWTAPPCRNTL